MAVQPLLLNTSEDGFFSRCTAALGVEANAAWSIWVLRVFFCAPAAGKPDRIRLCLRVLGQRMCAKLELPSDRMWFDWPLRLLIRAPKSQKHDSIRRVLIAGTLRVAAELGVVEVYRLRAWAWRMFIKPPSKVRFRRVIIDRVDRAYSVVSWPVRWVYAQLAPKVPSLPWERWAQVMERDAGRLSRYKAMMVALVVLALCMLLLVGTAPLSPVSQLVFFGITIAAALFVRRFPGRLAILSLVALSGTATFRYIWWRTTQTLDFPSSTEAVVGSILYMAEAYTWLILVFGYIQTIWPLKRKVMKLPEDPALWPSVDVFIPTYNEALSVVKPTVYAAQGIDWPPDRLRICILDDGKRPELREFARLAGGEYITRDDNLHAKAGNINHALRITKGEYIAIFDCDHIPTRSFLQTTMGTMLADEKCALVQTPHHFFSPDPFERNLGTFRKVPGEGSLFYGLVQDGNDLWNAAFFCGSCAVIRRAPLEQIGGIAVETVTEDAHTSLKLHRQGYNSAYLSTIQAAGLATETLAGHISQRIRWARGMAQIFRVDNPFFGKGLNLFQRLCYGNAMLHFFYGIPRMVFLVMPTAYLLFQLYFINASAIGLAAFVLPHIMLANIANSRVQGKYRHSFWAEVYESVLAWYVILPTTLAFFSPKHGLFNVTSKGGQVEHGYRDWSISMPYLILAVINLVAFGFGLARYFYWNVNDTSTVLINLFWTAYNMIMLGAAISVSREARQIRVSHRSPMRIQATLLLQDGSAIACQTSDYSMGGFGLTLSEPLPFAPGAPLGLCLSMGERQFFFEASVARSAGNYMGIKLAPLSVEKERELIQCTFGRADAWMDADAGARPDLPLHSMVEVIVMGFEGYIKLGGELLHLMWSLLALDRRRAQ
jgi:cellulose synthase (UDP-forming)